MPEEMRKVLQEAKAKGKINDDSEFSVENFFFLAKYHFHYTETEFWNSTPKRIFSLVERYANLGRKGGSSFE